MWDDDPDFFDILDEHDSQYKSDDDYSDSEHHCDPEDTTEDELLDEYSDILDYDH